MAALLLWQQRRQTNAAVELFDNLPLSGSLV